MAATRHPNAKSPECPSYQVSIGYSVKEKKRKKIQDSRHGGYFGYPKGAILAFFRSTSHCDAS